MKIGTAFVISAVIVLAFVVLIKFSNSGSSDLGTSGPDNIMAYTISQKFIERALLAPSTAKFPTYSNAQITSIGNTWKVSCYVDAQNGFGAMIRKNYSVQMSYDAAKDNWTLLDLKFLE